MAFVNEVVSDADIDKYGLPFKKGSGRYWTRDAERDMYLWGGKGGNPAFGEEIEGRFLLYLEHKLLRVVLRPGTGSIGFSESPYVIRWDSIVHIQPTDLHGVGNALVLEVLKEALLAYGQDGERNAFTPSRVVYFGF
jgi:hypothetical protein